MAAASASSDVFAISTTFTPPATCTQDQFTMMEKLQYRIFMNYPDPAVSGTTVTDCYPSQFLSSYLSQETATTPLPAIAPLVCPVGYSQVTTNSAGYLACCPSGFSLAPATTSSILTRPAYGGTCYTPISTILVTAYDNTTATATSLWAAPSDGAQAYALPIEGFATVSTTSSSSLSSSTKSRTSSTPVATSAASASSTPVSHASHAGAIAGGVVGGIAGLVLILGFIWFFLRRRRAKQIPPPIEKDEMYEPAKHGRKPGGRSELASSDGGAASWPAEKDGTSTPVGTVPEMDGRPAAALQRGPSELDSQTASTAGH